MKCHKTHIFCRLRARILKKLLTLLSFSALICSCGNNEGNDEVVAKKPSKASGLNNKVYSDARAGFRYKVLAELRNRSNSDTDSVKNYNYFDVQNSTFDDYPVCEYGVPPLYDYDIDEPDIVFPFPNHTITKYGVPINDF
jgi:hypothetical protein